MIRFNEDLYANLGDLSQWGDHRFNNIDNQRMHDDYEQ